jgi:hypothetical protein
MNEIPKCCSRCKAYNYGVFGGEILSVEFSLVMLDDWILEFSKEPSWDLESLKLKLTLPFFANDLFKS